jgi:diguanylate cyclase (GGDEF)-like protein
MADMPKTASDPSRSMTRRLALSLALMAAVLLAAGFYVEGSSLREAQQRESGKALMEITRSHARELHTRLLAAEAMVQSASVADAATGGNALRQRLLHSEVIHGVVLLPPGAPHPPVALGDAMRLALSAGEVLLRSGQPDGTARPLYLVRNVGTTLQPVIAYFELSHEWLWQGLEPTEGGAPDLVVLDGSGRPIYASRPIPAELASLFARERQSSLPMGGEVLPRSWNVHGSEWRGAVTAVLPEDAHLAADRWTLFASVPAATAVPTWLEVGRPLPLLVLLAAALVAAICWFLRGAWERPLSVLRESLAGLGQGAYLRQPLDGARDMPRLLLADYNSAVATLEHRQNCLAHLGAIDRLLLDSPDVESCLDRLLARVCSITGCKGAMLALLDPDATDHGRAYTGGPGLHLPVARISLDALLLSQLCQEEAGLTVARFEAGRHSLLEPLREQGADYFWLWPVLVQETLVGVLAVGYPGTPHLEPEVAAHGTECAHRISVALSNSARGEALYRQAHFDALTGLPNRLLFRDRLQQELAGVTEGRGRGALLYVDLDHFKKINDTVGHGAGDQMLQIVAQRLRSCVKDGDTVARLGGDEFTVILRIVATADGAQRVANRIIEQLQQPVNIGGRDHFVRASIGITLFPDDSAELDELMRNADLAMYRAKEHGRSRAVFYDRGMQRMPALAAESGLYRALQRREFSLYYQPQYRLTDGALVGLEALLRWQPPREAMRYPGEFVPAAEQSGLIVDIGAWVLEAACEQQARWHAEGIAPGRLALNVSVHQLRQPDFPRVVRRVLERVGIAPAMIEFEITESVFADEEARATLQRLAALGVSLALDDFGTGYSSLGYLRQHPVQTIKIDRSFIEEVAFNETAATLAETMITMAHALGKQVVAEGVETMEQLVFLRERNCDQAQGFYFSRPVSASDVGELLRARIARDLSADRAANG